MSDEPRLLAEIHAARALMRAQALGADHLLDHRQPDLGRDVRARTAKRGVDVVIDSVGEATFSQSLVALGKRGRLVTCGGTSGPSAAARSGWATIGSGSGFSAHSVVAASSLT